MHVFWKGPSIDQQTPYKMGMFPDHRHHSESLVIFTMEHLEAQDHLRADNIKKILNAHPHLIAVFEMLWDDLHTLEDEEEKLGYEVVMCALLCHLTDAKIGWKSYRATLDVILWKSYRLVMLDIFRELDLKWFHMDGSSYPQFSKLFREHITLEHQPWNICKSCKRASVSRKNRDGKKPCCVDGSGSNRKKLEVLSEPGFSGYLKASGHYESLSDEVKVAVGRYITDLYSATSNTV
jgi:hypothetical protein